MTTKWQNLSAEIKWSRHFRRTELVASLLEAYPRPVRRICLGLPVIYSFARLLMSIIAGNQEERAVPQRYHKILSLSRESVLKRKSHKRDVINNVVSNLSSYVMELTLSQ